ncbi:MAG: nuclear transport factor 2 family protein [Gammaproteobacteria bacterium]|nr:nuclear transport factor 2 family protein [Gammaproteobacteria bacterium]
MANSDFPIPLPGANPARRALLTSGLGAVAAVGASLGPVSAQAADCACPLMSRADYERYVTLFNDNDPRFIEYYAPDVIFELGTTEVRTPKGILDFYAEVKAHIKETVVIDHYVSDRTGIAAMMSTEFRCYKDWDSKFFNRFIKAGEVFRTMGIGLYWINDDGKFTRIRSARYKLVNDWQMEAG